MRIERKETMTRQLSMCWRFFAILVSLILSKEGLLELDCSMGITNGESFNALRYTSAAYSAVGKVGLARQCNEAAREMYVVLTGSAVGIEEVLEPAE